MKKFIQTNSSRKIIFSTLLVFSFLINNTANAQSGKKTFKFYYDAAGNRTKREYLGIVSCDPPSVCRTAKSDSIKQILLDSLFVIAKDIELKLPDTSTEKPNYDGSPELKNIYPNPTKGLFLLEFTNFVLNSTLQILDINGNSLDELKLDGIQWEIDLSLFPSGEYILIIKTKDGKVYKKKIVKI